MKSSLKILAIVLTVLATTAHAEQGESNLEAIGNKLRALYPATQFNEIRPSQFEGMYEVVMGKNVGYTDGEGRYFLFGHVFDMQTRQDLTQQRIDELNKVNFSELPLKDAIKEVRGKGQRKLVVFSDPDCPYCKKLEQELPQLDNVTIYTFPLPLEGLHPDAPRKAKSIWCSAKRQSAWHDYLVSNKQPTANTDCANPIDRNIQLGQKLGINGTPTLVAEDGRVMPGAASAEQIENWLNQKGGN
jgi:thiol:disulfide interchange protein DsbC